MQPAAIKGYSLNLPLLKHMVVPKIPSGWRVLAILQDIFETTRGGVLISVVAIYVDPKRGIMGHNHIRLEGFQGIKKLIRLHNIRSLILPPINPLCSEVLIDEQSIFCKKLSSRSFQTLRNINRLQCLRINPTGT